ncbi:Opr family porin [Campylobacter mucosalis]|uniref:Major outer membrane protein n=1 Tax=Campylobacter mucosalis CCUG 21559 TaxID=1032067 RepID=A0A6G5QFT9_9BACT|nr:Opr family porin [Campylobacter mucosalis]QCD44484.1 putative protein OprD family protein [Campylobacter mucosalis CCUG 21559]
MKKSLVLIGLLTGCLFADSQSLEEAFKNGKASGDVSAYFESRHINKGQKNTYYNNTSWAVGSIGLNYETDFYKNFKAVVGFRATAPFYEGDRNFKTYNGTGDSTERIYEDDRYLISQLYLEYNAYDTVVKLGRQQMVADWIGKINDGVRITNNSIKNLEIDALWTRAKGRAYAKEMWGFRKLNDNDGLFSLGGKYKFENGISTKLYGLYSNDIFSAVGGKFMYDGKVSDSLSVGGTLHYAQSDEKEKSKFRNVDDGKLFEALAYVAHNDTTFTLGYVQTGKKAGWGSMNLDGDQIVMFEEGDVMYERDVHTYYGMLSTMIQKLSATFIYGTTQYRTMKDETKYRQNEVSAWLSYPITNNLKALFVYDQVFKPQPGYPSLVQVSAGLTYSF